MASLSGTLLVARPALRDTFFQRAVILLLQHSDDGAFGLVLNRPTAPKDLPFPVYVGGPCKMEGLLMIHGHPDWQSAEDDGPGEVCPGVFLGDAECFEKVSDDADPGWKFRIFVGYAGWGPTQLESELKAGAWVVLPGRGERIFDTPAEELWESLAPPTTPQPSLN